MPTDAEWNSHIIIKNVYGNIKYYFSTSSQKMEAK